jgi:hypothetical protein
MTRNIESVCEQTRPSFQGVPDARRERDCRVVRGLTPRNDGWGRLPLKTLARSARVLAVCFPALLLCVAAIAQDERDAAETITEIEVVQRVTSATDRALEYLALKQQPDGRWVGNNGVDGVALLAFMGRGHVPGRGPYREVLERGKRHILSTQGADGYFVSEMGSGRMYGHALATLAMSEMYGMDRDPKLQEAVRKAVGLIVSAQSPNGGWRYQPTPGDHDLSVTVMQIVALRSANNAEVPVPENTIKNALAYVRSCNKADSGAFCYQPGNNPSAQMTAAGILSLQLLGEYNDPLIAPALDYLSKTPIQWGVGGPVSYFFYFHYYAIQAQYQAGGEHWNNWHPQIRELLLTNQQPDGSWAAPGGNEGNPGTVGPGNIYPTAMACLVLEIYMHFLPAYQR